MDKRHQDILRLLRKTILKDIDVNNGIIRPLTLQRVLNEGDVKKIETGMSKQEKAEILLDILPRRGPCAFDVFHEALQHHYKWLGEKMNILLESSTSVVTECQYHAEFPNFPPISPLTVTREEKTKQLQNALEELKPKEYIVLHGMKGFGKSSLTASTLKDSRLVKSSFCNQIYWLKFGYKRSNDEEILIQLNMLYRQVRSWEILSEPLKSEPLVHFFKHYFSKENHRNALLILDDVCNKKFIDAFDFDCKTLVITTDIDALEGRQHTIIEMNDGFTEAETLGLFAKMLDTDVNKLPPEAKRIHEECKGMPLLIAMFSAQFEKFKEDMNIRPDRWRYYLNCLRKMDSTNKVIGKFLEKQRAIFNMCIDQLPHNLKACYKDLAIFSEDVNIMPQTLEILWEGEAFKIEELMLELCHKSLAAKQWNDGLKSYVYGVHDLLLCHLRYNLTPEELIGMHRSFIEKYRKYCNNDFSRLPKDNYSYSYIGHHLELAKLNDEFPKLYLDFDFIQSKIYHTGLSDLFIDLKKYRKYITNNYDRELEKKIVDLEEFLEKQAYVLADHRHKECLDVVQIAMNYPYQGFITQNAELLAIQRPTSLYLYRNKQLTIRHVNTPSSEEVFTEVCIARFTNNPNQMLIGNECGEIVLWDCENRKQKSYSGHSKKYSIKKIIVSEESDRFVSLSDDGSIKLFVLSEEETADNLNGDHVGTLSPRQKQACWSDFFSNRLLHDNSLMTFFIDKEKILDVTFCDNDNCIAACTNKGTIQVWDLRGNVLSHVKSSHDHCLQNIAFTTNKSILLHAVDALNGVLITYSTHNGHYSYASKYNPQLQKRKIISFHSVPRNEDTLIIMTDVKAVQIKWSLLKHDQIHSYYKREIANIANEETVYVCAAVTYDGQYLVTADTGGFVNVWEINGGFQPIATYKGRVTSLDTYWMHDEGCHLICGSENRSIHRWRLELEGSPMPVRMPSFDAIMKPFGQADIIAMETLASTIIVRHNDRPIAETESVDGKIISLYLFSDGDKILCGTENGTVTLFEVESKKTIHILKTNQQASFIKVVNIERGDIIVCRENDCNLKVWHDVEVTYLIESTGYVISIHVLNEKHVITVARDGVARLWNVSGAEWRRLKVVPCSDVNVIYSDLSSRKTFLAILNENQKVILYAVQMDNRLSVTEITLHTYMTHAFERKLTCCAFSYDEIYLAVGLDDGDISIIDTMERKEIHKLSFHRNIVNQLHWAPSTIDVPILLSVNCDELAWWNIALLDSNKQRHKRSRMGISHSTSSPSIGMSVRPNFRISGTRSVDSGVSSIDKLQSSHLNLELYDTLLNDSSSVFSNNINYEANVYWRSKKAKDPKRPALLGTVKLPPTYVTKVCISSDFSKFLVVDIYGSISTFTLFGYT